jgi:hypothetical protein
VPGQADTGTPARGTPRENQQRCERGGDYDLTVSTTVSATRAAVSRTRSTFSHQIRVDALSDEKRAAIVLPVSSVIATFSPPHQLHLMVLARDCVRRGDQLGIAEPRQLVHGGWVRPSPVPAADPSWMSVDGMIVTASVTPIADSRGGGRGGFLP